MKPLVQKTLILPFIYLFFHWRPDGVSNAWYTVHHASRPAALFSGCWHLVQTHPCFFIHASFTDPQIHSGLVATKSSLILRAITVEQVVFIRLADHRSSLRFELWCRYYHKLSRTLCSVFDLAFPLVYIWCGLFARTTTSINIIAAKWLQSIAPYLGMSYAIW